MIMEMSVVGVEHESMGGTVCKSRVGMEKRDRCRNTLTMHDN